MFNNISEGRKIIKTQEDLEKVKKLLFFISLFFIISFVKAEKFTIEEYIEGAYVRMVSPEKTKNLNVQVIRNSNYDFVYCIEPFILVDEDREDYDVYKKDLSGYKDLTKEQLRKISLIAFYGWGYKDRMTEKWYAITQMLIWKTANPDDEFYFTDTKGGNVIDKYTGEMTSILVDVNRHDTAPSFVKDFIVNYKDTLMIEGYTKDFAVVNSDYEYVYEPSYSRLKIDNVEKEGTISFERSQFTYNNDVTIYSSGDSQDLIEPGKVINEHYDVNVSVTKGGLTLDIRSDNTDIYSVQSKFVNTCYEITSNDVIVDTVCSKNKGFIYLSKALPYGEYFVRQVSVGTGYEVDNNIYKIVIDGKNDNTLVLKNSIIRNKIELTKFYCYKEQCMKENNAVFNVYDINERLVGSITTNEEGYGYLEVGYGSYVIVQDQGLDNYTFVDVYEEEIISSDGEYYKELYNYYIEEDNSGYDNSTNDELEEEIEELPEITLPVLPDKIPEELPEEELPEESNNEEIEEEKEDLTQSENEIIEEEVEEIIEPDNNIVNKEEILPPVTGTRIAGIMKILYNIIMIVVCCCIFKKFCYNN